MEARLRRTSTTRARLASTDDPLPSIASYRRTREEFFARNAASWPATLLDPFDILAPHVLTRAEIGEIRRAAAGVARVYRHAATLLRLLPDRALLEMGVPDYVLPTARRTIRDVADCVVGRLDLARTPAGYKLLEFNADVPGLLVEAFAINGQMCRDAGAFDPNELEERRLASSLGVAVRGALQHVGKRDGERGHVVVTWLPGLQRDAHLAHYISGLLAEFRAVCAPTDSLSITADGLYDQSGTQVDVLYRLFPLHVFRDGLFCTADPFLRAGMGGTALELIEQGRLVVLNPPAAFLLENKALQVVIWNLCKDGLYFGPAERRLVEQYLLPTYLDPPRGQSAYVVKPMYGAEGDTVQIVTADGTAMRSALCTTHAGAPMVYQQHVQLPTREIMTEFGPRRLHILTSCFLIGGVPSAICMRAGSAITDESAWVLPAGGARAPTGHSRRVASTPRGF